MIQGHLRRFPRFDDLSDGEVRKLERLMKAIKGKKGQTFVREGEDASGGKASVFLIIGGQIEVVKRRSAGGWAVKRTMVPGDLFGLVALLKDGRRTATCRAAGQCLVGVIDRKSFEALAETEPALYARMHRVFARQLAADNRTVRNLLAAEMATEG